MTQEQCTYKFKVGLSKFITLLAPSGESVELERDQFIDWIWGEFGEKGLLGVYEGTLLSEQASEQGLETESWTVDGGEAPRDRDWVQKQSELDVELYFGSESEALSAVQVLKQVATLQVGAVQEQPPEDWDAQWKASFLNAGEGVQIEPFWRILPPWVSTELLNEKAIKINPGAGFGTGTHEATQLCLQAIGEYSQKQSLSSRRALDFGSGSGILAIGMALLGAQVDAVEIDPLAIDNSKENAQINDVEKSIFFHRTLPSSPAQFEIVVANILRPILIEFSEQLCSRLMPGGVLILSGLIESDVPHILKVYQPRLKPSLTRVLEKGEWRAVVFEVAAS